MQLRLPCLGPPRQLQPARDRAEPALWVRRVRILRELSGGEEHIVRDVELRRGLNIVWAPPEGLDNSNALFRSGMAGRTAGKTTFCRLVRHALGERSFASEGTRRRIREKLPSGWLVAEVIVGGRPWVVARPLGIGPHPFCLEGGDADMAAAGGDRGDYQAFLDAVASVSTARLSAARFPTRDEPVRWEHVLPWLIRDQDCRFRDRRAGCRRGRMAHLV